jgi:hypothetical protein
VDEEREGTKAKEGGGGRWGEAGQATIETIIRCEQEEELGVSFFGRAQIKKDKTSRVVWTAPHLPIQRREGGGPRAMKAAYRSLVHQPVCVCVHVCVLAHVLPPLQWGSEGQLRDHDNMVTGWANEDPIIVVGCTMLPPMIVGCIVILPITIGCWTMLPIMGCWTMLCIMGCW